MMFQKTYAEEVASVLNAKFPEFGLAPAPDRPVLEQRRCFAFRVSCPSATVTTSLAVDVTEREVTIEFLGARYLTVSPQQVVAQLRGIFDETTVVDKWYAGPHARGGEFAEARHRPRAPTSVRGITRIVRWSWKGTHDGQTNVG